MQACRNLLPWLIIAVVLFFAVVRTGTQSVPRSLMAALAIALFVAVAWRPEWRERLGITTRDVMRQIALGAVTTALLSAALLGLMTLYWGRGAGEYLLDEILHQPLGARLDFLAMGVAAAIGEELLFRGYLQPMAIERFGRVTGVLLIALAFTLSHPRVYAWPPYMFANLFLTGLIYGLLRGRDRPLTSVLVAHTLAWVIWGGA